MSGAFSVSWLWHQGWKKKKLKTTDKFLKKKPLLTAQIAGAKRYKYDYFKHYQRK
jgi:hypothetical protein